MLHKPAPTNPILETAPRALDLLRGHQPPPGSPPSIVSGRGLISGKPHATTLVHSMIRTSQNRSRFISCDAYQRTIKCRYLATDTQGLVDGQQRRAGWISLHEEQAHQASTASASPPLRARCETRGSCCIGTILDVRVDFVARPPCPRHPLPCNIPRTHPA